MTTAKKSPTDEPVDDPAVDETAVEPAAGTVVRLDDPSGDGEPAYALAVGDGHVIRLGPAAKYELQTYRIG